MHQRDFSPRARSFTLIELLVVLGLIAIILSMGIGVYQGLIRATALQAETAAIVALVQSARTTAIDEGGETFVCVNPAANQIYPFGRTRAGVWHFEELEASRTYGAFGHVAIAEGGTPVQVAGKVGNAIQFDGSVRLKCKMLRDGTPINIPTYDARDGLAIDAWVLPLPQSETKTLAILSRDGWFNLTLAYDAAKGQFSLNATVVTLAASGAGYTQHLGGTAPVIRPNEWTHVSLSCHKLSPSVTLRINGVEQPLSPNTASPTGVPSPAAETVIGALADGGNAFCGRMDELILSVYSVEAVHTVTAKLKLEASDLASGNTVRFDAFGHLTPEHNGAAPKIILKEYAGSVLTSSATVTVGPMGAIDVATWSK